MPAKSFSFNETLKFLRRTGAGTFELVEPHLLYLETTQAEAYLSGVMKDKDYIDNGFHGDLICIARQYARSILSRQCPQPQSFELVELGPGYPDKTWPLLEEAVRQSIPQITYVPVDVSPRYLNIASEAVSKHFPSIRIRPAKKKFEDLDAAFFAGKGLLATHIFIGPTYMNFSPETMGKMLRQMATKDSMILAASELLTRTNTAESITARYKSEKIRLFAFGPLANLGYFYQDFESDVRFNYGLNRIEIAFKYKGSPLDVLAAKAPEEDKKKLQPFKVGDEIITFVSYRASVPQLNENLDKDFARHDLLISPSGNTALALCQP